MDQSALLREKPYARKRRKHTVLHQAGDLQ